MIIQNECVIKTIMVCGGLGEVQGKPFSFIVRDILISISYTPERVWYPCYYTRPRSSVNNKDTIGVNGV